MANVPWRRGDYAFVSFLKKVVVVHKPYSNGCIVRVWPEIRRDGNRTFIQNGYFRTANFNAMRKPTNSELAEFIAKLDQYAYHEMQHDPETDPDALPPEVDPSGGFDMSALDELRKEIE